MRYYAPSLWEPPQSLFDTLVWACTKATAILNLVKMATSSHRLFIGDARSMGDIPDHSVELVVTSPPYWQLKDYGHPEQIGFGGEYEDYINDLNLVWMECERALKPGCRMAINVGDQFARAIVYGRYKVVSIQAEIIRFCETLGLDYMGTIIWQKVTNTNTTGGATIMGSFPYPRNGIVKLDYEHIILFRKAGKAAIGDKAAAALSIDDWNEYFSGHWSFRGERQHSHLAPFPVELPHRLIRMFTFPGETVLDPFVGSGTTAVAAHRLDRNSIGYELNSGNVPLIQKRMGDGSVTVLSSSPGQPPELPYHFVDPHKLTQAIDPKKFRFGSKIVISDERGSRTYQITSVTPEGYFVMDSGLIVRPRGLTPPLDPRLLVGLEVELKFGSMQKNLDDAVDATAFVGEMSLANYLLAQCQTPT